jgi:hypothetical protein
MELHVCLKSVYYVHEVDCVVASRVFCSCRELVSTVPGEHVLLEWLPCEDELFLVVLFHRGEMRISFFTDEKFARAYFEPI